MKHPMSFYFIKNFRNNEIGITWLEQSFLKYPKLVTAIDEIKWKVKMAFGAKSKQPL